MTNGKNTSAIAAAFAATMLALTSLSLIGCAATDVVGAKAVSSFKAIVDASKDRVSYSAEDGAWSLSSPGGDEIMLSTQMPDAEISLDAAPFLAAGLDVAKLPGSGALKYELEEGRLMLHFELGAKKFAAAAKDSIEASFAELVRTERARIDYHEKLDHFGIKLGEGNMLEWAKDMGSNDKDLVLVLNPEPLIAAGLDPSKAAPWSYAKVESKDDSGKTVFADKLLRAYNL
jgi:hypothetical protein